MTKKSWAFSYLVAAISATLHETFVRNKYASCVSQFLLYLKRFCSTTEGVSTVFLSFLCLWNVPGWGHLITWMDSSVGHLNGILARVVGNLNNNFQKSQMPRALPGGACWSFDLTDTLHGRIGNFCWKTQMWVEGEGDKHYSPPFFPFSLSPTPFDACYAGYIYLKWFVVPFRLESFLNVGCVSRRCIFSALFSLIRGFGYIDFL